MASTVPLEGSPTWLRDRRLGHYGGALDKHDSTTEGRAPYAWWWYRELRAAKGSTFRSLHDMQGLVHAETLAFARGEAAKSRAADKLALSSTPSTSGDKLDSWVDRLAVPVHPEDTRHDVRTSCIAKYRAVTGPTRRVVDEAVSELLGDVLVRTWRQEGSDLDSPPPQTYWPNPTADPLVLTYAITDEAWLTERCHYVVETIRPAGMSLTTYRRLLDVQLYQLLDRMLPVWATFNWAEGLSDSGFSLDLDELDYTGLTD
jgi:hypothetical protein